MNYSFMQSNIVLNLLKMYNLCTRMAKMKQSIQIIIQMCMMKQLNRQHLTTVTKLLQQQSKYAQQTVQKVLVVNFMTDEIREANTKVKSGMKCSITQNSLFPSCAETFSCEGNG